RPARPTCAAPMAWQLLQMRRRDVASALCVMASDRAVRFPSARVLRAADVRGFVVATPASPLLVSDEGDAGVATTRLGRRSRRGGLTRRRGFQVELEAHHRRLAHADAAV